MTILIPGKIDFKREKTVRERGHFIMIKSQKDLKVIINVNTVFIHLIQCHLLYETRVD